MTKRRLTYTQRLLPIAALLLLVAVLFGQSAWFEFTLFDDPLLVTQNPYIKSLSWASLRSIFTNYDPELYVPLTFFSYQLNYLISGLQPGMYHATNALLHVGSTLLAYIILLQLLRHKTSALLGAALFALHPLQVESVAWIAGRKDVLSTFFAFASLACFLQFFAEPKRHWWYGSIALFVAALLAKPTPVLLPLALVLISVHRLKKKQWLRLFGLLPFFTASAFAMYIAVQGKPQLADSLSAFELILLACRSLTFYLEKLLWPFGLAIFYPASLPISLQSTEYMIAASVVILALIIALAFRRHALVALGIVLAAIFVAPSFGNAMRGDVIFVASDRYMYPAMLGISLLLGSAVKRLSILDSSTYKTSVGVIVAVLLALTIRTQQQLLVWQTTESVFAHAAATVPDYHASYVILGHDQADKGNLAQATRLYTVARSLRPDDASIFAGLGSVAKEQGQPIEAIELYTRAIRLRPSSGYYFQRGALYEQLGQLTEAKGDYQTALGIWPDYVDAMINLAVLEGRDNPQAEEDLYRRALSVQPNAAPVLANLGSLLLDSGRTKEALQKYTAALKADPLLQEFIVNYVQSKKPTLPAEEQQMVDNWLLKHAV